MTVAAPTHRRPSVSARRAGYGIAVVVDAALLYLVNVWPGWDAVPFLTNETTQVLGWVNASLVAGIVVNLAYIGYDARWFRAAGDLLTTSISLVAVVRVAQVFPFSFDHNGFDWTAMFHLLLWLGVVGTAVAVVVQIVTLVRTVTNREVES